jgi:hypothetical protein
MSNGNVNNAKLSAVQPPHALPIIEEEPITATGECVRDSFKSQVNPSPIFSSPPSPGTKEFSRFKLSTVRTTENDTTGSSFSINKASITMNDTKPLKKELPTPELTPDRDSEPEYGSNKSTSGSSTYDSCINDEDKDIEMDEEDEAIDQEWEELKKEIKDEEMQGAEDKIKPTAEKLGTRIQKGRNDNKENEVLVDKDIYDRLYNTYYHISGEPPSDTIMIEMQNAYITQLTNPPPPFIPQNRLPNSSTIPVPTPTQIPYGRNYAPIKSSPLASSAPFSEPSPAMVFLAQPIPAPEDSPINETTDMPPLVSISSRSSPTTTSPSCDELEASTEKSAANIKHDNTVSDTVPSSPVEDSNDRGSQFQCTRKVGKAELLEALRHEAKLAQIELDSAEACNSDNIKDYAQRLKEAISRVEIMEQAQVGELDAHQVFLTGLLYLFQLADSLKITSLPAVDSTAIPVLQPNSTLEVLAKTNNSAKDKEPDTPINSANSVISYNQHRKAVPQCPSQPITHVDPRTIPIRFRPYFTGGANDFVKRSGGAKRHLLVDVRGLTIEETGEHVPQAFLKRFTELYGPLSPFIFPGRLAPAYDWPLDVPISTATTFGERVAELRKHRRNVETVYQATCRSLSQTQLTDCLRPHLTLYKRVEGDPSQLIPVKVDRMYFWQRLHPVWNPLLKPIEAAFLRGAIYSFYAEGKADRAEALERLLRTPHFDDWETRELVALGALDDENREDEALMYFQSIDDEHWEFHANEEAFRKSANEMLEDMDEDITNVPAPASTPNTV